MDDLVTILEQVERIINEQPWYNDDYGRCICFFCGEDHPGHANDCPYRLLKLVFQKSNVAMQAFLSFTTTEPILVIETDSTDRACWMEM